MVGSGSLRAFGFGDPSNIVFHKSWSSCAIFTSIRAIFRYFLVLNHDGSFITELFLELLIRENFEIRSCGLLSTLRHYILSSVLETYELNVALSVLQPSDAPFIHKSSIPYMSSE